MILLWSLDSRDYTRPAAGATTARVLQQIAAGDTVLLHESFPAAPAEIDAILDGVVAKGLTSVTASQLRAATTQTAGGADDEGRAVARKDDHEP